MSPIFAYAAELYREMREEFELTVEAAYAAAEEGTGGAMLNKHGRAEGIDAYSLMTGPWSRVEKYGAPELIEWCETNGRPSVARFEREWFASWQGEVPEPDADLRAVIDTAIEAAGPPRMMDREDACNTLNKVLDLLRSASQAWETVIHADAVEYPADGVERTTRLALGFDGSELPGILVSFPQGDPYLSAETRAELIQRFRDAQGVYPVHMYYDHPVRHAADC